MIKGSTVSLSTERKQICSVNYKVMIKMRKGKNVNRKIYYLKSRETIYKISIIHGGENRKNLQRWKDTACCALRKEDQSSTRLEIELLLLYIRLTEQKRQCIRCKKSELYIEKIC
jgi:hypothetical protein